MFMEKVSIHSLLKGYENEKAAQNLASRSEGHAFDIYLILGELDKKDAIKIKEEQ